MAQHDAAFLGFSSLAELAEKDTDAFLEVLRSEMVVCPAGFDFPDTLAVALSQPTPSDEEIWDNAAGEAAIAAVEQEEEGEDDDWWPGPGGGGGGDTSSTV